MNQLLFHTDYDSLEIQNEKMQEIRQIEQQIDIDVEKYRDAHIQRMKAKKCSCEAGILYDEMLTDLERIGDHLNNIAYCKIKTI